MAIPWQLYNYQSIQVLAKYKQEKARDTVFNVRYGADSHIVLFSLSIVHHKGLEKLL